MEQWLSGGGGQVNGEFNKCRVSVLQVEKSSGDWLQNNTNTLNMTEVYT